MYSSNGDFGKVRLAHYMTPQQDTGLLLPSCLGWHKCNDLYKIARPRGSLLHLILITTGGEGCLHMDDKEYTLLPGTIMFVPRRVAVKYFTPKNKLWEFYWIQPSNQCDFFFDAIAKKELFFNTFNTNSNYPTRIEKLIKLMNDTSCDNELDISMEMSYIMHLCVMDLQKKNTNLSISDKVCLYINQHFTENFTLDTLADELYVSTPHLIFAFKKDYGCTPHQYLLNRRLSYSIELLKFSTMQINEISTAAGFSSPSHYISAFKKKFGCSPGQYEE